jgi:hypothetical protein
VIGSRRGDSCNEQVLSKRVQLVNAVVGRIRSYTSGVVAMGPGHFVMESQGD